MDAMNNSRKSKIIFELAVWVPKEKEGALDFVKQVFELCGIAENTIVQVTLKDCTGLVAFFESRAEAGWVKSSVEKLKLKSARCSVRKRIEKQWLEAWKKDWKPFHLTKDLDVVPVWTKKNYNKGKRDYILLDTITSFGTGLHETTRFMAQFINGLKGQFESFFDIGTGTGILSLVASKCAARHVQAIDISDTAVEVACQNMKVNGFTFEAIQAVDLKKLRAKQKFDYVAANLVSHDLVEMKNNIFSFVKDRGRLAISGISLEKLPFVLSAYQLLPLKVLKIKKGKKWAAVLYQKQ